MVEESRQMLMVPCNSVRLGQGKVKVCMVNGFLQNRSERQDFQSQDCAAHSHVHVTASELKFSAVCPAN